MVALLPCIAITRHTSALYEWAVLYGDDLLENDAGATSITESLYGALSTVPEICPIVEISYQGMPLGAYRTDEIEHVGVAEFSERIVERYRLLFE